MAYTPPNTITTSTVLTAADLEGNNEALRLYLHEGINVSDFEASQWIQTRHLQPPLYEPYAGVQHGVSGHLGGQQADGTEARLSFCTSFLTGGGLSGAVPNEWVAVPNTSFEIDLRRPAKVLFHWMLEMEHGPDNKPFVSGRNPAIIERLNYITPYVGNRTLKDLNAVQEGQNHQGYGGAFWTTTHPVGATLSYPCAGAYGQRDGVVARDVTSSASVLEVGLCHYGQIDRVGVVNWTICIETYYV